MTIMSYDVADALAIIATSPINSTDDDIKGILASASEIPAERIDAAFAELKGALPNIRMMAVVLGMVQGKPASAVDVSNALKGARWNDDGVATMTTEMTIKDENGETLASASATIRTDLGAD